MNIEFLKLTVSNFGSFADEQSFNFGSLEHGAYFIRGDNQVNRKLGANGSGKSTFFINALCWVLTGRTPIGLRSTDIKPWNITKAKTTATLELAIDGTKHTITRTAPNLIHLDETEVAQNHIDKLTRLSFPILKQTVLFGQHEPLFFDLANKDKLAILSEVLELDKWEVRSQKASERVRSLELKATQLSTTISNYKVQLEQSKRALIEAIEASKRWKSEKAERLAKIKQQRADLKAEQAELEKRHASATRIAKDAAQRVGELQADTAIVTEKIRAVEKEDAKIFERQRMLKLQIKEIERELEDLQNAKICPTCGQPIAKAQGTHKKEQELKAKQTTIEEELAKLNVDDNREAIEQFKNKLIKIRSSLSYHQAEYDKHKAELDRISLRLESIIATRAQLTNSLKDRRADTNPHIAQIKKLKETIAELETSIKEINAAMVKNSRRMERAKFWIKGFRDVRLFIIEDVLQELELTTNAVLAELGLSDWQVSYAIERETKSGTLQTGLIITILSPSNDKPVKWESWSGGEGQRLRLAGSLALSEVLLNYAGVTIDLEVFDEPTKHLNANGVDDFCELLAARARDLKRRIFLIDHSAIESAAFTDIITVVKTEKGSHIE